MSSYVDPTARPRLPAARDALFGRLGVEYSRFRGARRECRSALHRATVDRNPTIALDRRANVYAAARADEKVGYTSSKASRSRRNRSIRRAAHRSFSKDRLLDGTTPTSRTSTTTSLHHSMEPAVLPAEIEQLPDLSGYLKLASRPEWLKIKIRQ